MSSRLRPIRLACALLILLPMTVGAAEEYASHAPLRANPKPSERPLAKGPGKFADAAKGDDANDGSEGAPWKTIHHALTQLGPGDTLYLRGGRYFENVIVSLQGTEKQPITIRSYPGEQASIDGGLPEFQQDPAAAWEPFQGGAEGEYRSTKTYANIRDVIGAFGDSDIGLQTYWHLEDLRSNSGLTAPAADGPDIKPLYCGPGIHYDRQSGYIHVRLAHTDLENFANYQGETDPRKLPLVIAPQRSIPLWLDGAEYVRLQGLIVRGGGYETSLVTSTVGVDLDNVIIRGGTYCMRTENTQQFRFYRSAMYGNAPPWSFRGDGSLRNRPGRGLRDIARLTCHAVWTTNTGREFSVYALPCNRDWEVSYSEFTDSHDGPYLGGIDIKFHHNIVEGFQDDGIYLSQMYPRHLYEGGGARIEIYQNYFNRALTPIAFGGIFPTQDDIYIYRNVFDMRGGVLYGRPSEKNPVGEPFAPTRILSDHGSPPWPAMTMYQNTFVTGGASRMAGFGTENAPSAERPRKLFNNIYVAQARLAGLRPIPAGMGQMDANLYWSPENGASVAESFFNRFRKSPAFEESKAAYPAGFTSHSLVADPQFQLLQGDLEEPNDYRLKPASPAVNAGVELPKEWPDPLRDQDAGKPDLGAIPLGGSFAAGRAAAPE